MFYFANKKYFLIFKNEDAYSLTEKNVEDVAERVCN